MATIISTKTSGVGGLEVTGDASGVLQLASNNGTTAVTVDASQNVGIGTASPSYKLQVNGFIGVTDGTSTIRLANSGGVGLVSTITNHPLAFQTNDTEQARITTNGLMQFNSGYGSVATAYGCRAWVNFNGTGTVAIRASGNVTSITDNGVGDYTVNFTTAMPDGNYSSQIYCCDSGTRTFTTFIPSLTYYATSSFRFLTGYVSSTNGGLAAGDSNTISLGIFR